MRREKNGRTEARRETDKEVNKLKMEMDGKKKEGRGNEEIRRLYFQSGQGFFFFLS